MAVRKPAGGGAKPAGGGAKPAGGGAKPPTPKTPTPTPTPKTPTPTPTPKTPTPTPTPKTPTPTPTPRPPIGTNATGLGLPIADAGPDRTVLANRTVILNGRSSKNPSGGLLTYQWIQKTGTIKVYLRTPFSKTASFVAPNVKVPTILTFQLTVTNTKGQKANDTTTITAVKTLPTKPLPPIVSAGEDKVVNGSSRVILDGSPSKDPNGGKLIFQWKEIAGPEFRYKVQTLPKSHLLRLL